MQLDPKSAVAVFLNRHRNAEATKSSSNSVPSNDVQEDKKKDLREFLTNLFESIDFGSANFISNNKAHMNFYNKVNSM